jgi:hypothetical protein
MPEFVSTASTTGVTDVRADLARFDSLFGLPSANLQVITRFAGASMPYLANGEEAGDVEAAHEVAPASRPQPCADRPAVQREPCPQPDRPLTDKGTSRSLQVSSDQSLRKLNK